MKNLILFISFSITMTISFAGEFSLVSKSQNVKTIEFISPEIEYIEKDGYTRLTNPELGSTINNGMPELPTYTSFFKVDAGISYTVDYTVISSHTIEDVDIIFW